MYNPKIPQIINQLTEEHRNPLENFLNSLEYIDNGFIIAGFFIELNNNGIDYEIIKPFNYEDKTFANFNEIHFKTDISFENVNYDKKLLSIDTNNDCYILRIKQ